MSEQSRFLSDQPIELPEVESGNLFALGKRISQTEPYPKIVLFEHGTKMYLFVDRWEETLSILFPEGSGVACDLFAATRNDDDQFEGALAAQSTREAREAAASPRIYLLRSSLPHSQILYAAKQVHNYTLCVARTNGASQPEVTALEHFPGWGAKPRHDFFRTRGLTSGVYYCNSIQQSALDFIARPSSYELGDFREYETYSSNSLTYDAELGGFVFTLELSQKPNESSSKLIEMLAKLQSFLFNRLSEYLSDTSGKSFGQYFEKELLLNLHPKLLDYLNEVYYEPFVDEDDRFGSNSANWFSPTAIRFQIERQVLDPSFGTLSRTQSQHFELFELRQNWLKVNFQRVDASAYLKRLVSQANQERSPN